MSFFVRIAYIGLLAENCLEETNERWGVALGKIHVAAREVYLDFAAATPMADKVTRAMLPYFSECFYNPSAPYAPARSARAAYEDARTRIAHLIGARPGCVTVTAGATEANNLAFAVVADHKARVIVDAIEHESVLNCAATHPCDVVGVCNDGRVDIAALSAAICPETELISIELANGEIGSIQPIREIARVIATERKRRLAAGELRPLWLHTDASQAAGYLSTNVSSLGCDLMTMSAAKVYGPKQVGLLWAAEGVPLRPLVLGGGQESGVRSGTENVAGAVGFAAALELAIAGRAEEALRLQQLRDRLERRLVSEFPWALASGPRNAKKRLPSLLHLSFPLLDARRLVIALERRGVYVGTGSACAASKMRQSHVLQAIGVPAAVAQGSLRLTLGRSSCEADIEYAAEQIIEVVHSELTRLGLTEAELAAVRDSASVSMGGTR